MIDVTAKIIMTIKYNGRLLSDSHRSKESQVLLREFLGRYVLDLLNFLVLLEVLVFLELLVFLDVLALLEMLDLLELLVLSSMANTTTRLMV